MKLKLCSKSFVLSLPLAGAVVRFFLHFFAIKETKQRKRPLKISALSSPKLEIERKTKQVFCFYPFFQPLFRRIYSKGGGDSSFPQRRESMVFYSVPLWFTCFFVFSVLFVVSLSFREQHRELEKSIRCLRMGRHDIYLYLSAFICGLYSFILCGCCS